MNLTETKYRALKFGAYLDALEVSLDRTLEVLGEADDPESIRRRLRILIDLGRPSDAAALVTYRPIERRWAEGALRAAVQSGNDALRDRILDWAFTSSDQLFLKKIAFLVAHETVGAIPGHKERHLVVNPENLSAEQKGRLAVAFNFSAKVIGDLTNYSPTSNLDEFLIGISYQIAIYLGKMGDVQKLAQSASKVTPLGLFLGQHASAGLIRPNPDWPNRYRKEWEGDDEELEANIVAAILDAKYFNAGRGAFSALIQRVDSTFDKEERERLFIGLHELAGMLGTQEEKLVEGLILTLLEPGSRISDLSLAESHLKRKELDRAAALLDKWADVKDHLWVQLQVGFLIEKGDSKAALKLLDECVRDIVSPVLLSQVADLAFKCEEWTVAEQVLKRFLALKPDSISAYRNLAAIYLRQNDYAQARGAYTSLAALEPDNLEVKIDVSECQMEEGDLNSALATVNSVIAAPKGKTLRTLLLRAAIQKLLGENEDAFRMLNAEKSHYWDLPEFLFPYHEACYRAGHDEEASEVFQKILELRGSGRIPEGVIQAKTIDELVEYSKTYREHISKLTKEVLTGKLPWLGIAINERSPALWHWALKTQSLPWIPEEPENVATYSLYSTNGFEVVADGEILSFNRIAAPSKGTPIVIDYSALITLSRLSLIDKVLERYGEVAVASPLVEQAVHERERLLPHQLSQADSWINIRQRILDKKIGLVTSADTPGSHYISEYDKDDKAVTLRSLVESLAKNGLVNSSVKDRLMKVSHKLATEGVEIVPGAKLTIELITLKTLFGAGVLDTVVSNYEVVVVEDSLDEMTRDLRAYDLQRKTYEWHDALWREVREDGRFKVLPVPNLEREPSEDRSTDLFIAPFRLAYDSGRMLLTDDRAVQQWGNSIDRKARGRAFGTDAVLDALLDDEIMPIGEIADAYLSLMRWRYKFLCPPPDILLEYARRYPGVTAGADLELVAHYVHDCMRDPGLYGGIENTTPRMSMAMQFYLGWSSAYGTFLGSAWVDESIGIERSELLTRWVCEIALPAPPRATDLRVLPETSYQGKKMFLGQLGISLGNRADTARAERALRMAGALCNVEDDNLFSFLTEQMLQ